MFKADEHAISVHDAVRNRLWVPRTMALSRLPARPSSYGNPSPKGYVRVIGVNREKPIEIPALLSECTEVNDRPQMTFVASPTWSVHRFSQANIAPTTFDSFVVIASARFRFRPSLLVA
jgi:hypothetical protein